MDTWKYYDITHREHTYCNPLSIDKLDRLIGLLRLPRGAKVVEIASGKGEFLIRLAERYGVSGVGVDISPFCIADAKKMHSERAPESDLTFVEMNGADYKPDEPESFDLAACIGASWIWDGHKGTVEAMNRLVAPGGWMIVGEPYWLQDPPEEYLKMIELPRDSFSSHAGNVAIVEKLGLHLEHSIVSNKDDWDEYEGLLWYAAEEYVRSHPDDPDSPAIMSKVDTGRKAYLAWGRDTLGFSVYAFRKPDA